MSTLVIETPFDPQALYSALTYVSNIFNATSWQNLLKMFFMIALINGIISVAIYQKTDYFKQFIIALGCASILSFPIGANLAIKRSDTERMYTINNSKAPSVLIYTITTVNSVTKWFTAMAGSSINSPNYTGMYDAGIGSNANIIRNSMETTFRDPRLQSDMVQFIKECTLYDIRDGAVSVDALINNGNGFDLILNNTSPARFVSMHSTSASPEVKTCQMAAQSLKGRLNSDVQAVLTGKAANFFYQKDVAPLMVYSTAIQSSYQAQLNINSNVSQITRQNMFNHLLEVSGHDIARLVNDPAMAESAAIHMATARTAKKAAFQQSVIAQLGKELLPSMSSWFAIIIIMCFPFVVLIFVVTQFNNMFQILIGYMGTLFWICCWQPIFAIINGLANWELGRQLAKTGAFRQEGIPYGYINTVYDSLLSNHSMVGWMVILTPIIAGMVVYGTYRGFSHLGNSIFSTYSGASSSVGNEMSDGNLAMGNTNLGNGSLGNLSQNNTSANKYNSNVEALSGWSLINTPDGYTNTAFEAVGDKVPISRTGQVDAIGGMFYSSKTYGAQTTESSAETVAQTFTVSTSASGSTAARNVDSVGTSEVEGQNNSVSNVTGNRNTNFTNNESYTGSDNSSGASDLRAVTGQVVVGSGNESTKTTGNSTSNTESTTTDMGARASINAGVGLGIGKGIGKGFVNGSVGIGGEAYIGINKQETDANTAYSSESSSQNKHQSVSGSVAQGNQTFNSSTRTSGSRSSSGTTNDRYVDNSQSNTTFDESRTEHSNTNSIERGVMIVNTTGSETSNKSEATSTNSFNVGSSWGVNVSVGEAHNRTAAIDNFRQNYPKEFEAAFNQVKERMGIDPDKQYNDLKSKEWLDVIDALNPIAVQYNGKYEAEQQSLNPPSQAGAVIGLAEGRNKIVSDNFEKSLGELEQGSNFRMPKK